MLQIYSENCPIIFERPLSGSVVIVVFLGDCAWHWHNFCNWRRWTLAALSVIHC